MKEEDVAQLSQFVKVLEDSVESLEKSYQKKDAEKFNKLKSDIVQTQRKILEISK